MTTPWFYIAGFALFVLGMVTVAGRRGLPLLTETNGILIVSHVAIGAPVFSIFGLYTNVGAVFFAALMFGLSIKFIQYGADETRSGIYNIMFALILELGSIILLQEANILGPMFVSRVRSAGVCIVAFWLTLSLFITTLKKYKHLHPLLGVPLITMAMEIFYGVMFYPAAYHQVMDWNELVNLGLVGVTTSAIVTILSIPFLAYFIWFWRDGVNHPGMNGRSFSSRV